MTIDERVVPTATRSSGQLGATLRSVLIQPTRGFQAALRTAERRERAGRHVPEGVTPYVLGVIGGAGFMLLWLKLGGLLGLRDAPRSDFRASYVVAALVVGAVIGIAAQFLWGLLGQLAVKPLGGEVRPFELRLVWGAAAFPQVIVLLVLLPIDLLVVGPEILATDRLQDSLDQAWAALSVALTTTLGIWSLYLMERGARIASSLRTWKSLVIVLVGLICILLGGLILLVPAVLLSEGAA